MGPLVYHVNAFCGAGAAGNPGAVCVLDDDRPSEWMQMTADQMNLSETGFVRQIGPAEFSLRWFSPTHEVPLCGHVTLGAAHTLWNEAALTDETVIRFQTASGPLHVRRLDDAIEMALPANICVDAEPPEWLHEAFAVTPVRILAGERKYLVEVAAETDVVSVQPNFGLLRRVADRGVILTARSDGTEHDIVSRYFASYVGVDEDPATGSAHCCLVPYWSENLDKPIIRARQASRRGGELSGRVDGDRVLLTGRARTVLCGRLLM